jgi:hypothetical protein
MHRINRNNKRPVEAARSPVTPSKQAPGTWAQAKVAEVVRFKPVFLMPSFALAGSALLRDGVGHHVVQGHLPLREGSNGLHVLDRWGVAARLPGRDLGLMHVEVFGERLRASRCLSKPSFEVHPAIVQRTLDYRQEISGLTQLITDSTPVTLRTAMDARRQRFLDYYDRFWKNNGGRTAFMLKTNMKKARVSQLFQEDQPFGELAARKLALKLGLPADYFETTEGGLTRKAIELGRMFDAVPAGPEKDRFYAMATVSLESMATLAGRSGGQGPSP